MSKRVQWAGLAGAGVLLVLAVYGLSQYLSLIHI